MPLIVLVLLLGTLVRAEPDAPERQDPASWRQDPGAENTDLDAAAKLILDKTNAFRKENKLDPLKSNDQLAKAAVDFARFMARTHKYGHQADGRQPADRAQAAGYDYCIVLENIALLFDSRGYKTDRLASEFTQNWIDSPGHRKNMLNPNVTEIGVGVAQSENGVYYAVQLFGRPKSAMFDVKLVNQSRFTIRYTLGDKEFSLAPRAARIHGTCIPPTLRFKLPEGSTAPADDQLNPSKATTYTVENARKGVAVRVSHPA